jgi:hypothetical protein
MSPDSRQHRGAHPCDGELFDASRLAVLRQATTDLSWLLSRGYGIKSSLKLVGDRHSLTDRQRLAVSRAACSDEQKKRRKEACLAFESLRNQRLVIDGFNIVITLEAALGGGVLIICRDGAIRDLSGVHGSYRSVAETETAISLIGELLETVNVESVRWLFDKPISNSGRLAQRIGEMAAFRGWPWRVEVVTDPDRVILVSNEIAVTSDSIILDGAERWVNLASRLLAERLPRAWIVDFSCQSESRLS